MKRLFAAILLLCLVFTAGCALQADQELNPVEPNEYRLQAANDTGVPIHGFGYEWYRNDELVLSGLCTAHDGGYLEPDDLLAETFQIDSLGGEGLYRLRVFVLDADSADYCEETAEIDLKGGMLIRISISGQKGDYSAEISPLT